MGIRLQTVHVIPKSENWDLEKKIYTDEITNFLVDSYNSKAEKYVGLTLLLYPNNDKKCQDFWITAYLQLLHLLLLFFSYEWLIRDLFRLNGPYVIGKYSPLVVRCDLRKKAMREGLRIGFASVKLSCRI